jgi:hypothetical protein
MPVPVPIPSPLKSEVRSSPLLVEGAAEPTRDIDVVLVLPSGLVTTPVVGFTVEPSDKDTVPSGFVAITVAAEDIAGPSAETKTKRA